MGIICESSQFRDIILNKLRDLMLDDGVDVLRYNEMDRFPSFISDKDIVIVPPSWKIRKERKSNRRSWIL